MASLQEFLEVLADAYPDEKVRGTEFEPFLRDALVASPSHQFADVWLWDDWPGRDGPDRGIDLVAEDLDGGLWGIQSKLLGPDESLNWGKLSTLEGADLRGANLGGANLGGANLGGANLGGATQWPVGFDPVAAGVIFED